MLRSRSVSLALVALFVWLTGCTSYSQVEIGDLPQKGKVRVTLNDGERQSGVAPFPWTVSGLRLKPQNRVSFRS